MDAIILAGGLGTRLRTINADLPKPLMNIGNIPFIEFLAQNLERQGFSKIVLSLCYMREKIIKYFEQRPNKAAITFVVEEEPLGTGGAILNALSQFKDDRVVVILNGDSFIKVDLSHLYRQFILNNHEFGMVLAYVDNVSRYGGVNINENNEIVSFQEKGLKEAGYINAGVYLFRVGVVKKLLKQINKKSFSFETEFLSKFENNIPKYGYVTKGYFIDIGIPEDYLRAQETLMEMATL